MLEAVFADFIQGTGIGAAMFLMALPIALAVRLIGKIPASWGRFALAFGLFVLSYGVMRTFVGGDLMGLVNILLVPSAVYLLCAFAVSARWLWHGIGMLTLPVGFMLAIIATALMRTA